MQIEVIIIGAPVACQEGIKELWRDVANWVKNQLIKRYGSNVTTHYFDLFDPDCPKFPSDMQLPIVFVNEKIISSGGKISIPLIKKEMEDLKKKNDQ